MAVLQPERPPLAGPHCQLWPRLQHNKQTAAAGSDGGRGERHAAAAREPRHLALPGQAAQPRHCLGEGGGGGHRGAYSVQPLPCCTAQIIWPLQAVLGLSSYHSHFPHKFAPEEIQNYSRPFSWPVIDDRDCGERQKPLHARMLDFPVLFFLYFFLWVIPMAVYCWGVKKVG